MKDSYPEAPSGLGHRCFRFNCGLRCFVFRVSELVQNSGVKVHKVSRSGNFGLSYGLKGLKPPLRTRCVFSSCRVLGLELITRVLSPYPVAPAQRVLGTVMGHTSPNQNSNS